MAAANNPEMDNQHDPQAERRDDSVESRLDAIARGTSPPPAQLPAADPEHIPATTYDSNVIASLVMGILSLVGSCFPFGAVPLALVGLIIGLVANSHHEGSANLGVTLNAIALALSVIFGLIYLARLIHYPF